MSSSASDKQAAPDTKANETALLAAIKAAATGSPSAKDPDSTPVNPSSTSTNVSSSFSQWFSHPFSVTWRAALVKAPRLVPLQVLKFTDPEGPYPMTYEFKSPRGQHIIPLYIWVPPPEILIGKQLESGDETGPSISKLPVVIDFHGGGFVLGSCLEQAPFASQLCRTLPAVVISVDYRMGPIAKFPAAIWDAEDVLKAVLEAQSMSGKLLREAIRNKVEEDWSEWKKGEGKKERKELKLERKEEKKAVKQGRPKPPSRTSTTANMTISMPDDILDPTRIAISGFSSGGNLALNMGIHIKPPHLPEEWPSMFPPLYTHRIPLLLFYPALDTRLTPGQRTRPANLPASSPFWTEIDDILMPSYLPKEKASHLRASPGLAPVNETLHPMAKALLVLPELDSLTPLNEEWVKKVEEAQRSGDLKILRYPEMKHGWTQFPANWLSEPEQKARTDSFLKTIEFVRECWNENA